MLPNLMTVRAVADYLGVSQRTIWRWIKDGKLRAFKVGKKSIRVAEDDLKLFIEGEACEVKP